MPSLQDQLRGLVYSTEHGETCPDCRQPINDCECQALAERERLVEEIDASGSSAVERLVQRSIRALSLLSKELGVAVEPSFGKAILEHLLLREV